MPVDDPGDTAWLLLCAVLVLLMASATVMVYAGRVRARHALSMVMYGLAAVISISVTWVFVGFSLAFGADAGGGFVGNLDNAGLASIAESGVASAVDVPPIAFALFQVAVAVFAGALLVGAGAERMKFGSMLAFLGLWSALVVPVVTHWTMTPGGWLAEWGVLDFAGGTVIGTAVGASALALSLALGPRRHATPQRLPPRNLPIALTGFGLLWCCWVGLNAGAALSAGRVAASAALATHLAGVGGMAGWLMIEKRLTNVITASGAARGGVTGLVAVTAGAGFLDPFASLLLGFVAGAAVFLAVRLMARVRVDDALDVSVVHLVGGALGMVFIGLFARLIESDHTVGIGVLNGGGAALLGKQMVAVLAVAAFAFIASWLIAMVLRAAMGLRVTPEAEEQGLDHHQQGESADDARR